ncbi:hypothetical protein [Mariniflexile maritimum]|uniref:hypothetical protein n=1 Tax=Mariniflexile maritimum TaxID=2682493 RepID=UPI0012F69590|nr:hypothetical protein [Mariniflexile maritimum]
MEIYLIALLLVLTIIIGLIWLSFWLPKKLGYPKFGKYLSIIVGLIIGLFILSEIYEDELFSKNNASELLAEQNIKLNDDFEIIENKSMSSIGDYYHTFKLKISEKDKARIIDEIKKTENFNLDKQTESYFDNQQDYYNGPKRIKNYETESQFIREFFEPQGKGYAPTWRKIEIDKKENLLTFEDIDE